MHPDLEVTFRAFTNPLNTMTSQTVPGAQYLRYLDLGWYRRPVDPHQPLLPFSWILIEDLISSTLSLDRIQIMERPLNMERVPH